MREAVGGAGGVHIIWRRKYPGFTAAAAQGIMGIVALVKVESGGMGPLSCSLATLGCVFRPTGRRDCMTSAQAKWEGTPVGGGDW